MWSSTARVAHEVDSGTYLLYQLHTCADGQVHGTCETNDNYCTGRPGVLERWAVTFKSLSELRMKVVPKQEGDGFPAVLVVLDGLDL